MKQTSSRRGGGRRAGGKTPAPADTPATDGRPLADATDAERRAGGWWFVPAAAALVVLGIVVRCMFLGDIEFKGDEAMALVLGSDFLAHPRLVTHGMMSSIGWANPPASVYFFAVAHAVGGGDPTAATVTVIAWNGLGLALFAAWLMRTRRHSLGAFWCLWALGLLCLNPWAVIYSRKIWAQDLLPPLVIGGLWCLEALWDGEATSKRATRVRLAVGILLLLVAAQVHMSGILWMAALAAACVLCRPPRLRSQVWFVLGLTAVAGLILYVPWLIYLAHHGLATPMGSWSRRIAYFAPEAWFALRWIAGTWHGQGYPLLSYFFDQPGPGGQEETGLFFSAMGPAWRVAEVAVGVFSVGAWLAAGEHVRRSIATRQPAGPTQWLTVGLAAYVCVLVAGAVHAHPHYAIVALPAAVLVLARGLERAETRWLAARTGGRWALRGAAAAALGVHLWTTLGFLGQIHTQGGTHGDYGMVLHAKVDMVNRAIRMNAPPPTADVAPEIQYLYARAKGQRLVLPPEPRDR